MRRSNHRGPLLLDQVYFVADCVAWVLPGSTRPPLSKEEEPGLISKLTSPQFSSSRILGLAGCLLGQGSLGPGGCSPKGSRICRLNGESTVQGRAGHGLPHVGLEGRLLPRGPALEVVGHPASQCQGPVGSLQVPLS